VIFDVIVVPLAAFVLFRDLSHENARISHTMPAITNFPWREWQRWSLFGLPVGYPEG